MTRTRPDGLLIAAVATGLLTLTALVAPVTAGSSWDGNGPSCSEGKG